jgi:hypothetical protein
MRRCFFARTSWVSHRSFSRALAATTRSAVAIVAVPNTDLLEGWARIRRHLGRARLEFRADDDDALARYQLFLDHNELGLALDELDAVGRERTMPGAFWSALADAAREMQDSARAEGYRRCSQEAGLASGPG